MHSPRVSEERVPERFWARGCTVSVPEFVLTDRLPQWAPTQRVIIALVAGVWFLGLFFHGASGVASYRSTLQYLTELSEQMARRGESEGTASGFGKLSVALPEPETDALCAVHAWAPSEAIRHGLVWQPVSYALLHDPRPVGFWHVLSTVSVLVLIGGAVEKRYGPGRFLLLLAGAAVCGAVAAGMLWPGGRFVGAGAPMLALVVVFTFSFGQDYLRCGRVWLPARGLGWALLFAVLLTTLVFGRTPDSPAATVRQQLSQLGLLAGGLFGYAFYRLEPGFFERWIAWQIRRRRRLRDTEAEIRSKLDQVLDKLNTEGPDALTRRERAFLRDASRFLRRVGGRTSTSDHPGPGRIGRP